MSTRAQVAVLVAAAVLAGGGIGALVVSLTRDDGGGADTGTRTAGTTTAASSGAAASTTIPQPTPNPPLQEAVREVESKGYRVQSSGSYQPDAELGVLIGVLRSSADGTAQKAFFFADGRFIGTDTADTSAGVEVESSSSDEVSLRYALYKPRDPQCCPSGGSAIVTYQWDGSSLKPLQQIPPSSEQAALSRR